MKQSRFFLSLFLSLIIFGLQAQENEQNSGDKACLTPHSDLGKELQLQEESVHLTLWNRELVDELEVKDPKNFDLKNWIIFNNSFRNEDSLIIKTGKIEQIFCLKPIPAAPKSRGAKQGDKGYVKFPVFFATDRNYNRNKTIEESFGNRRADLRYGLCEISIPNLHTPGEIEEPSLWKLEFEEDPKEHIVIHSAKLLSKKHFLDRVNQEIAASDKKTSFLFIHGYNVSFTEAAKRTAQISYDLLFDGVPVFYSWPSKASLSGYTNDEANISWAQANIKNFLQDYLSKTEAEEIYLIAHSMGNRGLTGALVELLSEQPALRSRIKEVILAAPDIDADIFRRDIAPKMAKLTQNPVTLYVSKDDMALKASKLAHGYPRAGDVSDGLILIDGVETVDASGTDTSFLGHSYFAESRFLISDIFNLIKTGRRAEKRNNLRKLESDLKVYWEIRSN